MAYAPRLPELRRRAAALADKIFKGAKPTDRPASEEGDDEAEHAP